MATITQTITSTPTWQVYLSGQLLGEVTFTLEKPILKFTVSSNLVFGDYEGTAEDPFPRVFKPGKNYTVAIHEDTDSSLKGTQRESSHDGSIHYFELEINGEDTLQLKLRHDKKTYSRDPQIIQEDNYIRRERKYTLTPALEEEKEDKEKTGSQEQSQSKTQS